MRGIVSLWLFIALLSTSARAQYHHGVYLTGGNYLGGPSTTLTEGLIRIDLTTAPVARTLFLPGSLSRSFMDADNQHVLVAVREQTSPTTLNRPIGGLFRLDPSTGIHTTLFAPPATATSYHGLYNVEVDQNGDYLCQVNVVDPARPTRSGIHLFRITRQGVASTLFTHQQLASPGVPIGAMTRDIDTGHILMAAPRNILGPNHPILSLDVQNRVMTTWNTGGGQGWDGSYSLPQSHWNGRVEGALGWNVFQVARGSGSQTTLATLSIPGQVLGGGKYDLQTARDRRFVYASYTWNLQSWIYWIDRNKFTVTATQTMNRLTFSETFDFYRGRHTQPILTGPRQWSIQLSAPPFAGRSYAIALSLTGARPGVMLPDGRRVNLRFDALTTATLLDRLRPIFAPGSGALGAAGRATAHLDLSSIPRLGVPLWIAWAVLDPSAPFGIALLPDTYVMRI